MKLFVVVASLGVSLLLANGCKKASDAPVNATCKADSDCVHQTCTDKQRKECPSSLGTAHGSKPSGGCAPEYEKAKVVARCKAGACVAEPIADAN